MSLKESFYTQLNAVDKAIYDDYCLTLDLDPNNKHSFALFYEFKKSGLTW